LGLREEKGIMREITALECDQYINNGHGFGCFMGGGSGDKDKSRVEQVNNKYYLLEPNEPTPKFITEAQAKEAKAYAESLA